MSLAEWSLDEWLGQPTVEYHKGLDLRNLPMNHAYAVINTSIDNILVYSVDKDCFHCPYKLQASPLAGHETAWMIDSRNEQFWRMVKRKHAYEEETHIAPNNKQGWICQMRHSFQEYGVYRLDVGKCEIVTEVRPANTYLPLILCTLILCGIYCAYSFGKYVWNRAKKHNNMSINEKVLEINVGDTDDEPSTLHVFRGAILGLIIFATAGGGGYKMFLQSDNTNGLPLAECLYFAFSWSVGLNIPVLMNKAFIQQTKKAIVKNILLRFLVLMFADTAISSTITRTHSSFAPEEIWRPLFKLGIAYFIAALAYVLSVQKFEMKSKKIVCKAISNLIALMWCWIISGFLLSIIIILISTLISLNCLGNLNMTEALDFSESLPDESQNCNNALTLNANVFMVNRYEKVVNVHAYLGFSQGIMGQMSMIINTMIGLKAGVVYANYKTHSDRIKLWAIWALFFGLGGIFFAAVSYPLEFNLWPIASILLISAATMLCFAAVYVVTEIKKFNSYVLSSAGVTFLIILPAHMLFSYSLPFTWIFHFRFEESLSQHMIYVIHSYSTVILWSFIAVLLMKKKIGFAI